MIRRKRQAPDGEDISDELHSTTRGDEFLALQEEDLDLYVFTTDSNLEIVYSATLVL